MRKDLVYDLPTRFFHWLFAGLFVIAFAIAKIADSESSWFDLHSLAGLTLGFLVVLRILWGFVGTQHARFSGFALNPLDLFRYFKGILAGEKKLWAGHNPASSWAGLALLLLGLSLAVTGFLMTSGLNKEAFEDVHEILAYAFVVVAVLHISGIILHSLRYREMIGLSMVDGKKADIQKDQIISSSRPVFGILLLVLIVAFALNLNKNYDRQNRTLRFFGTLLQFNGSDENASPSPVDSGGKDE